LLGGEGTSTSGPNSKISSGGHSISTIEQVGLGMPKARLGGVSVEAGGTVSLSEGANSTESKWGKATSIEEHVGQIKSAGSLGKMSIEQV